MSQKQITNEVANALLVAPVFPDTEWLRFPHDVYPPTDESVAKVKEIYDQCRTRISDEQVNFLFNGSYTAESTPLEYRNQSDVSEAYKNISPEDNFSFAVAIESYVEYLPKEDDYQTTVVRFRDAERLTHTPPFPSHPLIEEVKINGEVITAETHQIAPAILDSLIQTVQDCLDNCEHGGGYVPYIDDAEYEANLRL